ncbi:helix-turn-helix transcriptional regulator [Rhodococcus sp. SJ-2]
MTRQEVADRLKVPAKTLAQWASQGRGPRFARIGRHARYKLSDCMAWEEEQFADGSR